MYKLIIQTQQKKKQKKRHVENTFIMIPVRSRACDNDFLKNVEIAIGIGFEGFNYFWKTIITKCGYWFERNNI